ncbi:MAG: MFS transporter [Actinomycetia bacterium]|nr:MFS transporter [Actinomycetes bacterium]
MQDADPVADTDELVGGPLLDETSTAAATSALFLGIGLLMMGNGLNGAVLGIRASSEGFGLVETGLVMASFYAGFFAGSLYSVRLLASVGHIRVFAALASTASSVVLIHSVSVVPLTWAVMRFVFGACIAGLYVVAESWLNDLATNATRARLLATYMVVTMGGLSIGQVLLTTADANGFRLFILASVLVSLSLVPVTLSATSAPPLRVPVPMSIRSLLKLVPTGVIGSFWVGAGAGTLLGMGAVYGSAVGLSPDRIALFLTAPLIGAIVAQKPVGWLADRYPRRGVIFGIAVQGAAAATGLLLVGDGTAAALALMFVLGAALFPLYSLVVAYANDWVEPEQMVGASAALVRTNGAGAVVGPLVAAGLMAVGDARLFFATLIATHGMVAVYIAYRIVVADPIPLDQQRRFVVIPARGGALAASLIPRRRTRSRSSDQAG